MAHTYRCLIVLAAPAGTRKASGTAFVPLIAKRPDGAGSGPQGAICTPGWTHVEQAGRRARGTSTCALRDAERELRSQGTEPLLVWDRC